MPFGPPGNGAGGKPSRCRRRGDQDANCTGCGTTPNALVILLHGSDVGVGPSAPVVERFQKYLTVVEPSQRDLTRQVELAELEIHRTGICVYLKGIMRRAQKARDLAGELNDVVHHVRKCDEGR